MTLDPKIIDELKTALLKEKNDLEENLSKIARPVDKEEGDYEPTFEEIGSDKDDNALEVEQYAGNISVETALEKKLQAILEALEKIEKGTYGICENCPKDIDLERLRANPSARTCIKCQ